MDEYSNEIISSSEENFTCVPAHLTKAAPTVVVWGSFDLV